MTTLTATADRTKFLRIALALDAVVTGVNGLAYLVAAGPVGDLLGPAPALLREIGVLLLVYGAAVGFLATRATISPAGTKAVIGVNVVWALASVAAVIAGALDFTTLGAIWAIAQALVVGVFAEVQIMGLRRTR